MDNYKRKVRFVNKKNIYSLSALFTTKSSKVLWQKRLLARGIFENLICPEILVFNKIQALKGKCITGKY